MSLSPRHRQILDLALPIIGGMLSQNVLNLVDIAMLGSLADPDPALAAAGVATVLNFMAMSLVVGLATGVQTTAARRLGQGREAELAIPLNGGLVLALALGLPLSVLLYALAPTVLPLIEDAPEVVELAVPYWRILLLGVAAQGINAAYSGYWNGINRARVYLRTIVIIHLTNAALNWVLIFGHLGAPALGVEGAGWATTISLYLGALIYTLVARREAGSAGFLARLPDRAATRAMLKLSIPSGLERFFFGLGLTVFFAIVGLLGTAELAAANVLTNLTLVAFLPGFGFGLAASSLVSQALGAGDVDAAAAWGLDVAKLAMVVVALTTMIGLVAPDLVLRGFLREPETLALARAPMRLLALGIIFDVGGIVLLNALLGTGASSMVLGVSFTMQWLIATPAFYLIGPVAGLGLFGIWCVNYIYRIAQAGVFLLIWRRRRWASIEV